ncbi:3-methyl-2-oxobutanoate hydroxymethyltransferase (plasmid) [Microvirga sp. VF16]|nr:3-methyl-2-oxobutanoate hydroxymethyltransferase [Microvirga sp. VF16]
MSHLPPPDRPAITIPLLQTAAREGRRLVTAYDGVTGRLADSVVDIILVGDSVGNVCLGFDNTLPVSMAMMNHHLEAVARTKPRALLIADVPYLSHYLSLDDTGMPLIEPAGGVTVEEIKAKTQAEFKVALNGGPSNAA